MIKDTWLDNGSSPETKYMSHLRITVLSSVLASSRVIKHKNIFCFDHIRIFLTWLKVTADRSQHLSFFKLDITTLLVSWNTRRFPMFYRLQTEQFFGWSVLVQLINISIWNIQSISKPLLPTTFVLFLFFYLYFICVLLLTTLQHQCS